MKMLTCALHDKNNTSSIKISDIETIFNNLFGENTTLLNRHEAYLKILEQETISIINSGPSNKLNLENKIVLSIFIRIKCEQFMKTKISDKVFLSEVESKPNQTGKLFGKYKYLFENIPSEENNLNILSRMMIMTPENIHLNSFMYEPLLDMTDNHLHCLCNDVRSKLS